MVRVLPLVWFEMRLLSVNEGLCLQLEAFSRVTEPLFVARRHRGGSARLLSRVAHALAQHVLAWVASVHDWVFRLRTSVVVDV